jgi:hypothetical protein
MAEQLKSLIDSRLGGTDCIDHEVVHGFTLGLRAEGPAGPYPADFDHDGCFFVLSNTKRVTAASMISLRVLCRGRPPRTYGPWPNSERGRQRLFEG